MPLQAKGRAHDTSGGIIKVGMSIDPKTLDPRSTGGDLAWTELSYVLERLYEFNDAGDAMPVLAESWKLTKTVWLPLPMELGGLKLSSPLM